MEFLTDYQRVVDGLRRVRRWCCSPKRKDADLWRLIWDWVEHLGGGDMVQCAKVKAYVSQTEIDAADDATTRHFSAVRS